MSDEPETELGPTLSAPQTPTAWSEDGVTMRPNLWSSDAETLLYPDDDVSAYSHADERADSWRTVAIFAALMAVAVLAATWMAAVWVTHRQDAHAPQTAQTVQPSPDDHVVAAPTTAPAVAVPPPVDDNAYVAIAISLKAQKASYGMAGTEQGARDIAVAECKQGSGSDDCLGAEATHNGCVAVVMDASGNFSGGKGPDGDAAKADAQAKWLHPNHKSWTTEPVCSK